jgi:hypothetical protein
VGIAVAGAGVAALVALGLFLRSAPEQEAARGAELAPAFASGAAAEPTADAPRPAAARRRALLGEVVVARSGTPIAGATVRATLAGGAVEIAVTDSEGAFFFDGLSEDVRELRFAARGYEEVTVGQAQLPTVDEAFWSQALVADVGAHAASSDAPRGRLEGVVVDRRGQPVRSYRLMAQQVATPAGARERRRRPTVVDVDDAGGAFALELAPGRIAVSVLAEGFRPRDTELLELEAGEVERLRVVLEPSLEVHGRVSDAETGQPVPGARVAMVGVRGAEPALSDFDGRFTLRSVPEENTSLVVVADGYLELNAGGIDGRKSRAQHIELRLSPRRDGVGAEVTGIGVAVGASPDGLVVRTVYPGSPANGVLEPGDLVLEVDGVALAGRSLKDNMGGVRGQEGTTVRLRVKKKASGAVDELSLERRRVALPAG